jgi:hypothetical protein
VDTNGNGNGAKDEPFEGWRFRGEVVADGCEYEVYEDPEDAIAVLYRIPCDADGERSGEPEVVHLYPSWVEAMYEAVLRAETDERSM